MSTETQRLTASATGAVFSTLGMCASIAQNWHVATIFLAVALIAMCIRALVGG
jgi:hypothetical protein